MGRNAVISDMGRPKQKKMKNSIIPNADDVKDRNPFIDKDDKEDQKDNAAEAFVDKDSKDDDPSDSFIES
jgi:hypothetical protein